MYLSMTLCSEINILGRTGDFCRAWDVRKTVPGITSSYITSVLKLYLPIAEGRRERERKHAPQASGQILCFWGVWAWQRAFFRPG